MSNTLQYTKSMELYYGIIKRFTFYYNINLIIPDITFFNEYIREAKKNESHSSFSVLKKSAPSPGIF